MRRRWSNDGPIDRSHAKRHTGVRRRHAMRRLQHVNADPILANCYTAPHRSLSSSSSCSPARSPRIPSPPATAALLLAPCTLPLGLHRMLPNLSRTTEYTEANHRKATSQREADGTSSNAGCVSSNGWRWRQGWRRRGQLHYRRHVCAYVDDHNPDG